MGQQRRQFSPEFKADAVALVRSTGRPIAAIAHELGVGESNLSYWLKKDRESRTTADPGKFEAETAEARENAARAAPPGRRAGGGARDPETSHGLLGEGVARVRIFAFVAAQKADFPVRTLCRVCKVSASGFYAYAARLAAGPGPAAAARAVTAAHIARVHATSRRRYGSPRVTAQLAREGITVNHKAVEREMARQGLAGRCSRRKIRTTRRDPAQVPAADLARRHFVRPGTDELQIGDATYIWTDEGWCYLATVPDACSRRLLGWSITDHLRAELCLDALLAAVAARGGRRNLATGIVFHTDHGSQYTAGEFRTACRPLGITQSMGTVGDSYDNAMAESFFAGFKREVIDGEHYATRADARAEIFTWLNWYNQTRLHSSIGNRPPAEYEQHLAQQSLVA